MIVAVIVQILDLISFLFAVNIYGLHGESNPIASAIYGATGLVGISIFKLAGIGGWVFLVDQLKKYREIYLAAIIIAVTVGFLGYTSNILSVGMAL